MVMAKSEFQKQNLVLRDEMMAQLAYEREERQRKYKKRINTHRDEFGKAFFLCNSIRMKNELITLN